MPAPMYIPWKNPMAQMNQMLWQLALAKMSQKNQLEILDRELEARQIESQERLATQRIQKGEERTQKYQEEGRYKVEPTEMERFVGATHPPGGVYEPITGTAWGPKPRQWEELPPQKFGQNILFGQRNVETGKREYYTARPGATSQVNVTINGRQPLTAGAKTGVQKDVMNLTDMLARTEDLQKNFSRDYLTYQGNLKGRALRIMDKLRVPLSGADRDFLGKRRVFIQGVERMFNVYRQEITGAAASVAELDRLKESMLNKDMSPEEFDAASKAYVGELKRGIRLRNKFLREGIDVRNQDGGRLYDRQFLGGSDDNIDKRGEELEKQGLSEQEIIKQLETEGYL